LPLYVKEGAIIPLCPEMNYVGEKEIDEIELRIFPFERDAESKFSIVTDKESIDVIYKRENGKDAVLFGDTDIKINVAYI
jgi:alpha-glucosidase (family GH31 glycosyl hydrolase)